MFMEKPSCINQLKELASSFASTGIEYNYMNKVKEIIDNNDLSATQKIIKLKEIFK